MQTVDALVSVAPSRIVCCRPLLSGLLCYLLVVGEGTEQKSDNGNNFSGKGGLGGSQVYFPASLLWVLRTKNHSLGPRKKEKEKVWFFHEVDIT